MRAEKRSLLSSFYSSDEALNWSFSLRLQRAAPQKWRTARALPSAQLCVMKAASCSRYLFHILSRSLKLLLLPQGEIPHNQRSGFNEISLNGMQQSSLALVISYSNESQSCCLWRHGTLTHTRRLRTFAHWLQNRYSLSPRNNQKAIKRAFHSHAHLSPSPAQHCVTRYEICFDSNRLLYK